MLTARRAVAFSFLLFIAVLSAPFGVPSSSAAEVAERGDTDMIWSVQVWNINGMTQNDYNEIASTGANAVELQLYWRDIEPSPGSFSFSTLDANAKYAENAGLKFILIFWYGPFDPSWITAYELNSAGQPVGGSGNSCPPWWNSTYMDYYIGYVNATISRYVKNPDFIGAYVNYGWLDAFWYGGGYSPASEAAFRNYLEREYSSISSLNSAWGTSYSSFSEVTPPPSAGQPGWNDFEEFRIWSVNYTLNKIYSVIYPEMHEYNKTIFIYWGGDISNSWDLINYPDLIFWIARKYHAVINLDDNSGVHLVKLFSSLARAYGVGLMQEWTPVSSPSAYDAVFEESVAHVLEGEPQEVGYDYFVYPPNTWYAATVPIYSSLIASFPQGSYAPPNASVAALFNFYAETLDPSVGGREVNNLDSLVYDYVPFDVVTDYEIEQGVVNVSRFKYLVDLSGSYGTSLMPAGVKRALARWVAKGGIILSISPDGELYGFSASPSVSYAWPQITGSRALTWKAFGYGGVPLPVGQSELSLNGKSVPCLVLNTTSTRAGEIDSQLIPVTAGEQFSLSVYAEVGAGSPDARLNVAWIYPNGTKVEDQSAYDQQLNSGSGWLQLSGAVPSGPVNMSIRLIDDGTGVDYFANVTLSLEAAPVTVSLPSYAHVSVSFDRRLQSLELIPMVNRGLGTALLDVIATQFTPGAGTNNFLGEPLGNIPSQLQVALNASLLGLPNQVYYVVNLSDASLVAGPIRAQNGELNFTLPVSVPQFDFLELAPGPVARGITALTLNASGTHVLTGTRVTFAVLASTPFAKGQLRNATIFVDGSPISGYSIKFNSSGVYQVYASYGGRRSNTVSITVYSPATYVAAQLWWLIFVAPLALFALWIYWQAKKTKGEQRAREAKTATDVKRRR